MSIELIKEDHHQKMYDDFMRALDEYKALIHKAFVSNRIKGNFFLPRYGVPHVVSRVEIIPSLYKHLQIIEDVIPLYHTIDHEYLPDIVRKALDAHMRILFPNALTFRYIKSEDLRELYGNYLHTKKIIVDVVHGVDFNGFEFLCDSMRKQEKKVIESVDSNSPAYTKVKNSINAIMDDKTFPASIAAELYNKFEKEVDYDARQYDLE